MNNTFTLSTKPDLKLTVTGFVHSKAIQEFTTCLFPAM